MMARPLLLAPWMILVLIIWTVCDGARATASSTCTVVTDYIVGSKPDTFAKDNGASADECCAHCRQLMGCKVYTYEPQKKGPGDGHGAGTCYYKNGTSGGEYRKGAISGCLNMTDCTGPSPPSVPITNARVDIAPGIVFRTDGRFKSWNIDASPNREWDTRNLSDPKLVYLARESLPGYLRFGGSGNDGLRYGVGQPCPKQEGRCLNESHFERLMNFSRDAGSQMVFGLNIDVRNGSVWDPTDARALIRYAQQRNYQFYGFELGNEQNPGRKPASEAADFAVLNSLLVELFPDMTVRPRIIGPDVHGLHVGPAQDEAKFQSTVAFLMEFYRNATKLGVPLHGMTHHGERACLVSSLLAQ